MAICLGLHERGGTHTRVQLTALFAEVPRSAGTRKEKPIWILLKQETVGGSGISWAIVQVCNSLQRDNHANLNEARDDGVSGCSGISWTICKQSAPHFRQITTPTPHHSIFTGWMLFLTSNQQCQSSEGIAESTNIYENPPELIWHYLMPQKDAALSTD